MAAVISTNTLGLFQNPVNTGGSRPATGPKTE